MNNGKVRWRGSFPSVITPFTSQGEIDEKNFVDNIELLISEGIGGFIVAGSTGEAWALSPDERARLFRLGVETAKGRATVLAGVGDILTQRVVFMANEAKAAGADGVVVVPPFYAGVSRRGVVTHFKRVSDEARIPIMIYNIPADNGINVDADYCADLVDIDYIVAIKESSKDFIQILTTLDRLGDRIEVFAGHSAIYGVPLVLMGCVGCGGSLEQQVMGREGVSIYHLAVNREIEAARRVQNRAHQLYRRFGAIEGSGPAKIKAAMSLLGRPSGSVRPPLIELNEKERDEIGAVLNNLGLPVRA